MQAKQKAIAYRFGRAFIAGVVAGYVALSVGDISDVVTLLPDQTDALFGPAVVGLIVTIDKVVREKLKGN